MFREPAPFEVSDELIAGTLIPGVADFRES
jgi:hypothetical protein